MNPLPITLADMKNNAGGVVAVILLIAIAVALGVGISAQERAVRDGGNVAADPFDLIVGAPGSQTQLLLSSVYLQPGSLDLMPGELLQEIAATEGVRYAAPIGFGDNYQGRPIVGTIEEFVTLDGTAPLAEGRIFTAVFEAVVGIDVDLAIGDRFIPAHGQIEAAEEGDAHEQNEYEVVGRFARRYSPWDDAILVPIESVWYVHGLGTGHETIRSFADEVEILSDDRGAASAGGAGTEDTTDRTGEKPYSALDEINLGHPFESPQLPGVPAIAVKPDSIRDAYVIRSRYRNDPHTNAIFPAEVLIELYALLGDATTILSVVAVATQILVVGAVLLAVFAALQQKRKALGVLRALGAPRIYIFLSVWIHIVAMVTIGSVTGLFLGWGVAGLLSRIIGGETGLVLPVTLTGQEVVLVLVLISVGMLLASIPSLKVYRQSVSDVLRS